MVLLVIQFCPVCNFGKFINFGLGTVRSERVKIYYTPISMFLFQIRGLQGSEEAWQDSSLSKEAANSVVSPTPSRQRSRGRGAKVNDFEHNFFSPTHSD